MTANTTVQTYSWLTGTTPGSTGTGLDQIVDWINRDTSLAGSTSAADITAGAAAANGLNALINEAANATGASADRVFTADEVVAMNTYIRAHRLAEWTSLHGDDEAGLETGFHLVQGDGGVTQFRGANAINTVADGLYHLGFEIQDGHFLNEDGDANATVDQVASWLTALYTDHSSSGSGLDRLVDMVMADAGLAASIPESQIEAGADAANAMSRIIADAIGATGVAADGTISITDVRTINAWIRAQPEGISTWTMLHGDDENGVETGYHLVQNDGANTPLFGANGVNTVADGIFHLGFAIRNSNVLNEDGNANATLRDLGNWLTYFFCDQSTTGTGLDRIVDIIMADTGLMKWNYSVDTLAGAKAADGMNHIIVDAIAATNAMADGWITADDLVAMNAWIRADDIRFQTWVDLHGDDGQEFASGYHLVQNDGAETNYFGRNLVNTVADGIYHLAFDIVDGRFVNEDGDQNALLDDVAEWLNSFYKGTPLIVGTGNAETVGGTNAAEEIDAEDGDDIVSAGAGNDIVHGGWGNDAIYGGQGNDIIFGDWGDDTVDGGAGADSYRVRGTYAGGWSSFSGFDTYADTGTTGNDIILALGGDVDIGLTGFDSTTGIEIIDGRQATGTVTLLGDWNSNTLDFRDVTLLGTFAIDGGYGNDTIYGGSRGEIISGGGGDDWIDGGAGSDSYRVSGNYAGGWSSFSGFDTYADTGSTGTDVIVAIGADVDIGLTGFGPSSGIETIDARQATGTVRLIGDWNANVLDFRATSFLGATFTIDGGDGDDTIFGSARADIIWGGRGNDRLNLGAGSDIYRVNGNYAGGWSSFQGFDTYVDDGTSGTDSIQAIGPGDVDIGLTGFSAASGIEVVDGTRTTGTVRLLGDWNANVLDFSSTTFVGTNIVIDGGDGNDTITGSAGADVIWGGKGNDALNLGGGSDTYRVTGAVGSGFQGYDTYKDSGTSGIDTIQAIGTGNVDIGLTGLAANSGIDAVDASGATGTVRLLGDSAANTLDFRRVAFTGTNIVVDGGAGDDLIYANSAANTVCGSSGNDRLYGFAGNDTLSGGDGRDTVSGGAGRDVLTGGTGRDTFLFDTSASAGNVDTIADFSVSDDVIAFDDAVYSAIGGAGALAAAAFRIGAAAADADDRIVYNSVTGALYYDADGTGSGAQVQVATLTAGLTLTNAHFMIV